MLYVPFIVIEDTFKQNYGSWKNAYVHNENIIKNNRAKFSYNTNSLWGDIDSAIDAINDNEENKDNACQQLILKKLDGQYDMNEDIKIKLSNKFENTSPKSFEITQLP